MRLIDADELIEFINGRISDGSEDPASQYTIIRDETLMEIGSKVKSMPTVDAEPVKHGVWFGTVCSCCGASTSDSYDCEYCPHCGAKMVEYPESGEGDRL